MQRYQNVKNELEASQNLERINAEKQYAAIGISIAVNERKSARRKDGAS